MTFSAAENDQPAIAVLVNFGVFAGRAATPAEIDRLAGWLLDEVDEVSIISEERHVINAHTEASVHQVRIEVAADQLKGMLRDDVEGRILHRADHWARLCVAERHAEI